MKYNKEVHLSKLRELIKFNQNYRKYYSIYLCLACKNKFLFIIVKTFISYYNPVVISFLCANKIKTQILYPGKKEIKEDISNNL